MGAFPLQNELINAVVSFANADLDDPAKVVRRYFDGAWMPCKIPSPETCHTIQADVRLWLMTADGFNNRDCYDAMRGLEWGFDKSFKRLDSGIELKGWLSVEKVPVLGGHEEKIVWKWRAVNASLRAICGLAVGTIIQEGLHQKVITCQRDGCSNIVLDRSSRGTARKYCKSAECDVILNRQAVARSRKRKKK